LLAERGVAGGPIHDCLIAQVAVEHDATLVSRDRRAAQNYALIGATFVLLD
jgi:predicted nucleic acid-binding protein